MKRTKAAIREESPFGGHRLMKSINMHMRIPNTQTAATITTAGMMYTARAIWTDRSRNRSERSDVPILSSRHRSHGMIERNTCCRYQRFAPRVPIASRMISYSSMRSPMNSSR